jgi:nucleotide-binding universal stress UspA family protein
MIKKLLVAYDGSDPAKKAVGLAALIAEGRPSLVTLLGVVEVKGTLEGELSPELQGRITDTEKLLDEARERFRDLGCTLDTDVRVGNVTDTILEMASEGNYDLIVLGEKAHSGLVEFFLGTTAYNVSRRAPCSVVLAK